VQIVGRRVEHEPAGTAKQKTNIKQQQTKAFRKTKETEK
jgi:hypothetical protein